MFDSGPCDWWVLPLLLPTPATYNHGQKSWTNLHLWRFFTRIHLHLFSPSFHPPAPPPPPTMLDTSTCNLLFLIFTYLEIVDVLSLFKTPNKHNCSVLFCTRYFSRVSTLHGGEEKATPFETHNSAFLKLVLKTPKINEITRIPRNFVHHCSIHWIISDGVVNGIGRNGNVLILPTPIPSSL